ncbi:hypothetical protein AHAS_Ahas16G0198000 [Arachis hypogaea]
MAEEVEQIMLGRIEEFWALTLIQTQAIVEVASKSQQSMPTTLNLNHSSSPLFRTTVRLEEVFKKTPINI